jgi:biotin operon repressor
MDNEGWIKLHRKITEWEWYSDINTCRLFMHLLLMANHEDRKWKGITVKRGERVTSLESLSEETGLSTQSIRTSLNKLKSTGEITNTSTSKYRVISIKNYDGYQDTNKQINKQLTNNQQTTNNKQECKNVRSISKDMVTPSYGNKELLSLKKFLMDNYPKPLEGIADTRRLYNLKQIMTKRKNQDEWMEDVWKDNFRKFLAYYLESTEEKYLVNSVENLKNKAKLWREYRGKLN